MNLPENFTVGDIARTAVGMVVYFCSSAHSFASNLSVLNISFIEEGIKAAFSVSVAVSILLVSYIIRGVLEDKESLLHIKINVIITFFKFKKK